MIKYLATNNPADCCGCRGCEQICAHHALVMKENEEGFLYPSLDGSSCVGCGLCEKVCPMTQDKKVLHQDCSILAAQNLNKDDLLTSSSGGAFVAIAKEILKNDGVVYGAAFDDGPILCHQRITTEQGLDKLKGSKYIQSDIRDTYLKVKKDLLLGKRVYFVGTPCQVAGLRLFLRKEYDNLLLSDFVCHGTPSNKLFRNTIDHIEHKIKGKFYGYSFRDKRIRGWSCSSSSTWKKGDSEFSLIYSKDMEAYFNAFISGDLMRMSCYTCPYAKFERCGDITLGDYWGVRRNNPNFPEIGKGVSILLINTTKGGMFMSNISDHFNFEAISREAASTSNDNLLRPSLMKPGRNMSYHLAMNDYESFVDNYYYGNYWKNRLRVYLEYYIRRSDLLFGIISFLKKKMA